MAPPRVSPRLLRLAGGSLGVLVAAYVAVLAWLTLHQRDYFYFPDRTVVAPAAAGLADFQDVRIVTADGQRLAGWWRPPTGKAGVVLYLHGNGGNLAGRSGRLKDLAAAGFGVLAIDWRGYGGSSGHPTEAGLTQDARAAFEWAKARAPGSRIAVIGESLGTGLAVKLAAERADVAGLVLDSPYASMVRMVALGRPWVPASLLVWDRYPSESAAAHVHAPVLLVHCAQDRTIPLSEGQRLFAAFSQPKEMLTLQGCDHVQTWKGVARARILDRLHRWTDR